MEQLIFARDPVAALKLGQARGAILCAGLQGGMRIHEYAPSPSSGPWSERAGRRRPRSSTWCASCSALDAEPSEDEADALALAICHANSLGLPARKRASVVLARLAALSP